MVTGGHFWGEPIGRTLYLGDHLSPIIIQTGMLKDYGSFKEFQEAILNAPLKYADSKLEYTGPNSSKIEFFCLTQEAHEAGKKVRDGYAAKLRTATGEINKKLRFSSDFAEEKWPFGQRTSSSTLFEHLVEAATWKTDKVLDKGLDEVQNSKQFLLSARSKRLVQGMHRELPARAKARAKTEEEAKSLFKAMEKARKDAIRDEAQEVARKALETKGLTPPDPGLVLPKTNGKSIDLGMAHNYRSPCLESRADSDIVTVRYGKRRWEYDFGKNTVAEAEK